jgi:tripartite ATP-independent transporter DctM subunit
MMILYGSLTGTSVGKLFMGGVIPGILLAVIFILYIGIRCFFQPHLGPSVPPEERFSMKEKLVSLKSIVFPIALILLVLGVLYLGICTPTEAAGIGAMGAFLLLFINRKFTWAILIDSLRRTCRLSAMVLWILLGAKCFSHIYMAMGASELVYSVFSGLEVNRWVLIVAMQFILLILGFFMDPAGIIMICAPVFVPLAVKLGFDPVWFGILFTINTELGYITPPFGFNLFYMKGIAGPMGISMQDIYRSIIPFVFLEILGIAIIMLFPSLAMWLPDTMIGG